MTKAEVVRDCFASYVNQDQQAAERLIADDFVFTSPQDDRTGPTRGRVDLDDQRQGQTSRGKASGRVQ